MLIVYKSQKHDIPLQHALTASDIADSLSLGFDMKSKQIVKHHYRIKLMPSDISLAPIVRGNYAFKP